MNRVKVGINGDGVAEIVFSGSNAGEEVPIGDYKLNFQNSSLSSDNCSNRSYIERMLYGKWEDVPGQYKVVPMQHDPCEVGVANFLVN